ncbi:hypothetical protein [Bermanella sp. R86510]
MCLVNVIQPSSKCINTITQ